MSVAARLTIPLTLSRVGDWVGRVCSCRMFILLFEYGLVHRGDCINCKTCHFCFVPAFVWPSLGRADFQSAVFSGSLCVYLNRPVMRVSSGN